MDKKQIQRENLKNILYSIFDNYGDLSKKIYIVISDVENNKHICEEILKIIKYILNVWFEKRAKVSVSFVYRQ